MRLNDLATGKTGLIGFGRESRALESQVLARMPQARLEVIAEQSPEIRPQQWPLHIQSLSAANLDFDRILRSPGVPVDHPALLDARKRGIEITTTSSLWFAERPQARSIVITGSKGKSTTTALITHLLESAGQSVAMAGNIGIPLIGLLEHQADWFVIEMSSYQLVDLQALPEIGVITRLFPEHVDWHGSLENYYAAKLRLMDLLDGRPLWINAIDALLSDATHGYTGLKFGNASDHIRSQADGVYAGNERLLCAGDWPLIGKHNLDNLALAISVVASLGFDAAELAQAAHSFKPLPHRLQQLTDAVGRRWINDSISTTPYATQAALDCCGDDVVLLVGGLDRPADWQTLIRHRKRAAKDPFAGIVTLPDNGVQIADALITAGLVDQHRVVHAQCMSEAVVAASRLAGLNTQIVLSPGAPSFPHYQNFEDRGDQFMRAVQALA
ncbi:MAG: UDP-N-acetylmuramoyl-L-alanine--D-glutamate ligase [Pseudomonadota bacterium]